MANEVTLVKRTHLKGKPPILADGDAAIDWAITQGVSQATARTSLDKVVVLRGGLWRVYWIQEVARLT